MQNYICDNIDELKKLILSFENKKYNFIDIIQGELGSILMILNSFGKKFVENVGMNNIAICNRGHSFLYKDYASIIIEINFIDNKEIKEDKVLMSSYGNTDKYYNHRKISNYEWKKLMNEFKHKWLTVFEGIYHPNDKEKKMGQKISNYYGCINYMYSGIYKFTSGEKILTIKTGNRDNFNDHFSLYRIRSDNCIVNKNEKKNYVTIFARKGYKNKIHNFDKELLMRLIKLFQNNNIKVIIFEDIFKFDYPEENKNELLELIDMPNFFDVEKYINICKYSLMHFGTQTGANEINLYYNFIDFVNCDKNISPLTSVDYINMCSKKGKQFYNIWNFNDNDLIKLIQI